jgi:hypothetical protein
MYVKCVKIEACRVKIKTHYFSVFKVAGSNPKIGQ